MTCSGEPLDLPPILKHILHPLEGTENQGFQEARKQPGYGSLGPGSQGLSREEAVEVFIGAIHQRSLQRFDHEWWKDAAIDLGEAFVVQLVHRFNAGEGMQLLAEDGLVNREGYQGGEAV